MVWKLRGVLHSLEPAAAIELLIKKIRETQEQRRLPHRAAEELAVVTPGRRAGAARRRSSARGGRATIRLRARALRSRRH